MNSFVPRHHPDEESNREPKKISGTEQCEGKKIFQLTREKKKKRSLEEKCWESLK